MLVGFDVPGRLARLRQPKLTVVPRGGDRWVN
jgi:hypothetical protein